MNKVILNNIKTFIKSILSMIVDYFTISKPLVINNKTLLIVKIDGIGDYILFRNYLEVIRKSEQFKDYKITLCGNSVYKELAEAYDKKYVDEFIWIDIKKLSFVMKHFKNIQYRYNTLRTISKKGFEIAIQPTYSRDFWVGDTLIKASHAKQRIGSRGDYTCIKSWQKRLSDRWYTKLVTASALPLSEIKRNAEFFQNLGLFSSTALKPVLKVILDTGKNYNENNYYILCPGAGLIKRFWPLEHFAELAKRIHSTTGWTCVICGARDETHLGQKLMDLTDVPMNNIAGVTSLSELVTIISKAKLVVSNETSVIHIAAAIGTPSICILGGGHYGRFMPYENETNMSQRLPVTVIHKMDCFMCNWQCKYKTQEDTPFPCIKAISVDDVWIQMKVLIEHI
ncbi:MAG: glycosyltransferase family 9 protein [Sedimentisphaerales bacterium]|nr:glycosyltransferase family 9 protein [Sedimentisphaerales bacterium]